MIDTSNPLKIFHPLIQKWFMENIGKPSDIQARAWPEISNGKHVLITAPTGSGKTLTAFLWSINQLLNGTWPIGQVRVLYISPLKALNNDIQRNLVNPLSELKEIFSSAGENFPEINVITRSGDTPQIERRRMYRHPPEILITTPESLNIILTSKNNRSILSSLSSVIVDEIHALAGTKRGTHLITAIDRLIPLCGEFQRVSLSATVKPLHNISDFVGGYRLIGKKPDYHYEKRNVQIIQSKETKQYNVQIKFPEDAREKLVNSSWWPVLIESFKKIISHNKSTLFFANSRKITEKVTRLINETEPDELAYSHHGSLSREIRLVVEQRLKNGELKAIVATNSLELGIDIGDLDQVVLIQTPFSISSAIQRLGRAGHKVGQESSGTIFPTHGRDFVDAAVIARCIIEQDIEEIKPVEAPLDVLAQIILSMTASEGWDIDELFGLLKTSYPYKNLSRRQFDLVTEMLAGRFADTRLRELKPRISIDRIDNTIKAKDSASYLIYLSGGTIPDRGLFDMRILDSKSKIGELDEEFVWERSIGDTFSLGTQTWRIHKITHNDVEVIPVEAKPGILPFWKAEQRNRDFHFSSKISTFLEDADLYLDDPSFKEKLFNVYHMDDTSASELVTYLKRQKEATETALPHRRHLLIEHFDDPLNKTDAKQVILHTLWGGKVNRPFSHALSSAWEEKYKYKLEVMVDNDCILLMLPHEFNTKDIFTMVTPDNVEKLLRRKLEKTGFFGARFRENAGRALLLPKAHFRKRLPLWLNRLRSKKLLDAVIKYEDFPILLETWRTCLIDEFDLENLKLLLDEIRSGEIKISETITQKASPMTDNLIYRQTDKYMYEDDTPGNGMVSNLNEELFRELTFSSRLRPGIPDDLIEILDSKLKCTAPGYSPVTVIDILDFVKDRLLIPLDEWDELLNAVERDHELNADDIISSLEDKLVMINQPDCSIEKICAIEILPQIAPVMKIEQSHLKPLTRGLKGTALTKNIIKNIKKSYNHFENQGERSLIEIVQQWLTYYTPVSELFLNTVFNLDNSSTRQLIEELVESQSIVFDVLREHSNIHEICDAENLEILLRMTRRAKQPSFKALDLDHLPLFLASYHNLIENGNDIEALQAALERLFGYPASASAWEEYLLPVRLETYFLPWMDSLMQTSGLMWFGCGNKKSSFAFLEDIELFIENGTNSNKKEGDNYNKIKKIEIEKFLPEKQGKYSFFDIINYSGFDTGTVTKHLWDHTWNSAMTNDSFNVLRKGILNNFSAEKIDVKKPVSRRSGFNRWSSTRPLSGNWHALDFKTDHDPLEKEELKKDRIRILFQRYGIIFRELLERELQPLKWSALFKTLRLMELSGEILTGHFFKEIPGLQFISHEAFRLLNQPFDENAVYWVNAADPVSMCGIKLESMKGALPSRIPSTWLVYHGTKNVMIAKKNGREIEINTDPEKFLPEYLSLFKTLITREFNPLKSIIVETINSEPAAKSHYCMEFKKFGFTGTYKVLELEKKY